MAIAIAQSSISTAGAPGGSRSTTAFTANVTVASDRFIVLSVGWWSDTVTLRRLAAVASLGDRQAGAPFRAREPFRGDRFTSRPVGARDDDHRELFYLDRWALNRRVSRGHKQRLVHRRLRRQERHPHLPHRRQLHLRTELADDAGGHVRRAGERGWNAYLTTGEDEPAEAVVYCPECAEREFGVQPPRRRRLHRTDFELVRADDS